MPPSYLRDGCGIDPRGALNLLHHLQESSQAPHTLLVHGDARVCLVQAPLYIHYPPMGSGSVKRDRQRSREGGGRERQMEWELKCENFVIEREKKEEQVTTQLKVNNEKRTMMITRK